MPILYRLQVRYEGKTTWETRLETSDLADARACFGDRVHDYPNDSWRIVKVTEEIINLKTRD